MTKIILDIDKVKKLRDEATGLSDGNTFWQGYSEALSDIVEDETLSFWHPVNEVPPGGIYIVRYVCGDAGIVKFHAGRWASIYDDDVTHWAVLPPTEEE